VRATAFVDAHREQARRLGEELADLIGEPDAFTTELTAGLMRLSDSGYTAEQERVAPGSGAVIGVRWPLIRELERALREPLQETSSALVLPLAGQLAQAPEREVRLLSLPCLRRTLPEEPERSWQLLRRIARGAADWITVDTLAEVYAQGVLAEGFRWAEVEQLVYSNSRMERRLVGATVARIAHALPRSRRVSLTTLPALTVIKSLIGDADDQVRKSLSWALREWSTVDPRGVLSFLEAETDEAVASDDGNRAWVIRDALSAVSPARAADLRAHLAGIRRRERGVSTSRAAAMAAAFGVGDLADRALALQGDRYARAGA
jgi:3-methyladenine DNA glycosylase AlkD